MTDKKNKESKITKAPQPIKPLSGLGLLITPSNKPHEKQEVFIPVDGVELMRQWAVDWKCLFDLARQSVLIPDEPKRIQSCIDYDFGMLSNYPPDEIDIYFSQWLYNPQAIEKLEAEHPDMIEAWQKKVTTSGIKEQKQSDTKTKPVKLTEPQAENCFKQNGTFWTICFQGKQSNPIPHVEGMKYLHFLLKRPRESFSCSSLYQAVNGAPVKGKGNAISEGIHSDHTRQAVLTPEIRKKLQIELTSLENADYTENAEDTMIRKENEKRIDEIQRTLTTRNFPDNLSKAQSLITQNLKTAYKKILTDPTMQKAVEYFGNNIKSDGKMGLTYIGDIVWQTE